MDPYETPEARVWLVHLDPAEGDELGIGQLGTRARASITLSNEDTDEVTVLTCPDCGATERLALMYSAHIVCPNGHRWHDNRVTGDAGLSSGLYEKVKQAGGHLSEPVHVKPGYLVGKVTFELG